MLDVNSMIWTILSRGSVAGRRSMACTVVGDNFVAWGGIDTQGNFPSTIIYSLKMNQWTDTYIITAIESPPSNNKLGIYIGVGIAAGVVFVALLGWIIFRHRKKSQATKEPPSYALDQAQYGSTQGEKGAMILQNYTQTPRDPQGTDNIQSGLHLRNPQSQAMFENDPAELRN
ncbi:hypothetical protein FBU30_008365 [Linnemannia zychae]|nr:hypothetical protein FBU30_008365 [Linnemannia zychae]